MAGHQQAQAPAQAPPAPDYAGNVADLGDFAGALGEATGYGPLEGLGAMVKGGATYQKEKEQQPLLAQAGAAGGIGGALGWAGEALGSATTGMGYGMGTAGEWGGWALGKAGGALTGAGQFGGMVSGAQEWWGGSGEDSRLGGWDAVGNALSLGSAVLGTGIAGTTAAASAPLMGAAGLGTGLYVGAHKLNNMTGGAMWDPSSSPLQTAASGIAGAASGVASAASSAYSAVTDYDYLGIGNDIGF
jgi:hypothetical protein